MKRIKDTFEVRGLSVTYVINQKTYKGKRKTQIEDAVDYCEERYVKVRACSLEIEKRRNEAKALIALEGDEEKKTKKLAWLNDIIEDCDYARRVEYLKLKEAHAYLMKLGVVAYTH